MGIFELLWAYALVFLLAATPFFEVIGVIPIGIFAGLSTVPVAILALLGNILTVLLVVILVDKINQWRKSRKSRKGEDDKSGEDAVPSKRSLRARNLWQKYGLPGLAIIGPLIVGSHLTAFMSVSLGGTKKSTTVWMTISLITWSIIVAVLAHFGVDFMYERTGQEGFLQRYLQR